MVRAEDDRRLRGGAARQRSSQHAMRNAPRCEGMMGKHAMQVLHAVWDYDMIEKCACVRTYMRTPSPEH